MKDILQSWLTEDIGTGDATRKIQKFQRLISSQVQVTTAPEWDGSLSGARVREAVSWGKVRPKARRITVEGDATVMLPLILGPLL